MLKKIIQKIIGEDYKKPKAVQCLWYSDFDYLALEIELVYKTRLGYKKESVTTLNYIDFESQQELSKEAKTIGKTLAEKHNAEFYFPSPDEWSRECPDWWLSKTAFKCEDCRIPIIQTDSKYLPKEVCYPCHLTREQNHRIKNALPYDDGVSMYFYKNGEYIKLGYASIFESFTISPFIKHKISNEKLNNTISIISLNKKDIKNLIQELENLIEEKLKNYKKPIEEKRLSKFNSIKSINYKSIEYQFKGYDNETMDLISSFNQAQEALDEDFEYRIFFKKGFTYRDDSFLRFVNYVNKGETNISEVNKRYREILSQQEIESTITKLIEIECLTRNQDNIFITEKGKSIV
ncbi:hypothetical protein F7018_01025 [Tenacibaculum aiptasiae]|uniref:Uncharacterized protein n=1 Tax=Tenacibaculum aiptasiae TaxID=426481 RepID=A0A7J5ASF1_9FLAO|nr:hypothetical protein [Tenacibaculum aiptasiae]KAB1160489.1 hypothetical protein F7018_01025 [Tenacibaculum aiptasiae]